MPVTHRSRSRFLPRILLFLIAQRRTFLRLAAMMAGFLQYPLWGGDKSFYSMTCNFFIRKYCIMDNAPVHNKKTIRSLLKKHGHAMLALPPYSPDFNPIEQSFGAMKKRREGMPIETTLEEIVMSYS